MMGQKQFTPKLFHTLSLDAMVPEGHLLRRLEAIVNLSFVRELCAPYYSYTGQPSVDPIVLFKMMLLGYLYGITSERRLAEECSLHLAFRWYLGYDLDEPTPDHSVISKARVRYGKEVFEAFFQRVLKLCVEAGLVGGDKIFADSTLVTANASVKSLVPREQLFQPVLSPGEHLQRVFDENPINSSDRQQEDLPSVTDSTSDGADAMSSYAENTTTEQKDATQAITSLRDNHRIDNQATFQSKRGRKPKPRRITNILKVSRTDPDASIITRPGLGTLLAYKEHFTVDSHYRVITAVEVTPAACEDYMQVSKLLDLQPLNPREFCADSHYGVHEVYAELRHRGILPVIPRRSPQARKPKTGRLTTSAFQYKPKEDIFLCPQGQKLKRVAYDKRWHRYYYRPKPKDCRGCPQRLACSTPKTLRTIIRYPEQEAIDLALSYYETPEGQQTFSQRSSIVEWVIAEAKCFHGLRRAICRGLEKVKIQTLMIATVQNLKRLVKIKGSQFITSLSKIKQMFNTLIFKADWCLN